MGTSSGGREVRCALLKYRWSRPVSPNGSYFVDGLSQDIAEAKIFLRVLKTASIRAAEEKTCQTQTSLKTDCDEMADARL